MPCNISISPDKMQGLSPLVKHMLAINDNTNSSTLMCTIVSLQNKLIISNHSYHSQNLISCRNQSNSLPLTRHNSCVKPFGLSRSINIDLNQNLPDNLPFSFSISTRDTFLALEALFDEMRSHQPPMWKSYTAQRLHSIYLESNKEFSNTSTVRLVKVA